MDWKTIKAFGMCMMPQSFDVTFGGPLLSELYGNNRAIIQANFDQRMV